ncbi:RNA polymerase sigma factor [Actinomadura roseirufa]|uniref:RNA polymerase sigma factor n=1 Tax=Actinomadura roseirufa TaxID=2094049 RepID=UPI0010419D02|nr:sigma-70 family RNA polymerase sigma factor [Actinomadura roseirufa]
MRGDLGSLYDAHAARLYAYCWSLVGDAEAAAAVGDTFTAAVHQPPRGDSVLWLYALARTACAERGAFTGRAHRLTADPDPDPLLRAAGGLRPDHREVLLLWAGEWLEPHDIARVLGLAPDTVAQLLAIARKRLESAVLDVLMRGTAGPQPELITAFEKGRLPQLLARRAPTDLPSGLREKVLAGCEEEAARPLPSVTAPTPLVVIGQAGAARSRHAPSGISKGLGAAAGLAASAAAVVGLLVSWQTARDGGAASLVPTASSGQARPASSGTNEDPSPPPGLTGSERIASGSLQAPSGDPVTTTPGDRPQPSGPGSGGTPTGSPVRTPSGGPSTSGSPSPSHPGNPSTPVPGTPTTPPSGEPTTTPTDGPGTTEPTTPPVGTPTGSPVDPGTPSPSPVINPVPLPGLG